MAHKALLLKGAVSLLIPSCVLIVLNQRLPDTTDSKYKLHNINSFICSPVIATVITFIYCLRYNIVMFKTNCT